jgi:hypothetical protein
MKIGVWLSGTASTQYHPTAPTKRVCTAGLYIGKANRHKTKFSLGRTRRCSLIYLLPIMPLSDTVENRKSTDWERLSCSSSLADGQFRRVTVIIFLNTVVMEALMALPEIDDPSTEYQRVFLSIAAINLQSISLRSSKAYGLSLLLHEIRTSLVYKPLFSCSVTILGILLTLHMFCLDL